MMTRMQREALQDSMQELLQAFSRMSLRDAETRELVSDCLASGDALCQKTLSKERAAEYHAAFAGLLDLLEGTEWSALSEGVCQESHGLFSEILSVCVQMLQTEREIKKLMFFLPYQVSMWDSLETIYRAAAADTTHCEAYVLPIPYCDRNPDGSPGECHCELPNGIECLDFREYPLSRLKHLRPDAIFIHNPYDQYNIVTSVHPDYYAKNLREATDCLVYVPYCVSSTFIGRGLALNAGITYADYVIAESKEISRQIEAYNERAGNPLPKGKVLPLGSPKYDAVLTKTKEDFTLPSHWREICKGRTVVLYCTTLGDLLAHSLDPAEKGEQVLDNMRAIFTFFRAHREFALWWRPHPLMRETIRSMRPWMLEAYEAIEYEYIENGWGVYDDTPEVSRAVVCSDMYFGDGSSVFDLYNATGKPCVWQNLERNHPIASIFRFVEEQGTWGLFDSWRSIFYRFDSKTGERREAISLPSPYKGHARYGAFVKHGDDIILCPVLGHDILLWNIRTGSVREIGRPLNTYQEEGAGRYTQSVSYRDSCYFFGVRSNDIVKYDFRTKKITHLTEWFSSWQDCLGRGVAVDAEKDLFVSCAVHANLLTLAMASSPFLLVIDMDTDEWKLHCVGRGEEGYQAIDFDGREYWLMRSSHMPLLRWNPVTGTVIEYSSHLPLMKHEAEDGAFAFLQCRGDSVYLLPGSGSHVMRIHKETGEAEVMEEASVTYFNQKTADGCYQRGFVEDGTYYLSCEKDDERSVIPLTAEALVRDLPQDILRDKNNLVGFCLGLDALPYLVQTDLYERKEKRGSAGESIYRAIAERC